MAKKDFIKETEEAISKLLKLLGIKAELGVEEDKENEAIAVQIEAQDPGILIGRHGETIGALQLLLNQVLFQRTGQWRRVLVNVGDWRERRSETLKALAHSAVRRARETGEPQPLLELSAAERRIVHLELSGEDDVTTESEGEGQDRHLVVKLK